MNLKKEILNIQNFLNSCAYDNLNPKIYRPIFLIEKERKCICFDGAIYAKYKLDTLKIQNSIITMFVISNNKQISAHSICIYNLDNKFGSIGKSKYNELTFKENKFETVEDLIISFVKDLFKNNFLLSNYGQEDLKNIYEIFINSNSYINNQNLFKPIKNKKYFNLNQLKEILNKYFKIDEEIINDKIKEILK